MIPVENLYIRNEDRATEMINLIQYSPPLEFFKISLMVEAKIIGDRIYKLFRYNR